MISSCFYSLHLSAYITNTHVANCPALFRNHSYNYRKPWNVGCWTLCNSNSIKVYWNMQSNSKVESPPLGLLFSPCSHLGWPLSRVVPRVINLVLQGSPEVRTHHHWRSWVSSSVISRLSMSFLTTVRQLVSARPCRFVTGRLLHTFLQMLLSGLRRTWPNHFSLLVSITELIGSTSVSAWRLRFWCGLSLSSPRSTWAFSFLRLGEVVSLLPLGP